MRYNHAFYLDERNEDPSRQSDRFKPMPAAICLLSMCQCIFQVSEGGMIRLDTLVELKFINLSFSSSNVSIRVFRAYPLIEIRQTVPCRAIRGNSSDSWQQYLSQQYSPRLLSMHPTSLHTSARLRDSSIEGLSYRNLRRLRYVLYEEATRQVSH